MQQRPSDAPLIEAAAGLRLEIGSVKNSIDRMHRSLVNRPLDPDSRVRRDLNGVIGVSAALVDGYTDLGSPSQGWTWVVRSVFFCNNAASGSTPAMRNGAASAGVFSLHATAQGSVAGLTTGDTTLLPSNCIWTKSQSNANTGNVWDDPGNETVAVLNGDHLVAAVWNTQHSAQWAVHVVVESFKPERSREVLPL